METQRRQGGAGVVDHHALRGAAQGRKVAAIDEIDTAGDAIPLAGRMMAVADVYDALISRRVYKPALSHEDAIAIIVRERGKHFDPEVIDRLLTIAPRFAEIALRFADSIGEGERER